MRLMTSIWALGLVLGAAWFGQGAMAQGASLSDYSVTTGSSVWCSITGLEPNKEYTVRMYLGNGYYAGPSHVVQTDASGNLGWRQGIGPDVGSGSYDTVLTFDTQGNAGGQASPPQPLVVT